MRAMVTVSQALAGAIGAVLVGLGAAIWAGVGADQLVALHAALGLLLVGIVWALAGAGLRAGVPARVSVTAIGFGAVAIVFAGTQDALVRGGGHWVIQVLHVLVGLAAVALALALGQRIKRTAAVDLRSGEQA